MYKQVFYIRCYYIQTDKLGRLYFDTIDEATLAAARLKAMGFVAKIKRNPNPERMEVVRETSI